MKVLLDPPLCLHPANRVARPGRAHLIGIAGCGMAALADVLAARGWQVSGSDTRESLSHHSTAKGHRPENVPEDAALVVYSRAVDESNCELARARQLGADLVSYPQMVARLMGEGSGIAVAGTHGKSTTTAMAAAIFAEAGLDPTVVCGAAPLGRPSGGRPGRSDLVLVEACEFERSFLHLRPQISAILNIEPDHFDSYASWAELQQAFRQFAKQTCPAGLLLASADCSATLGMAMTLGRPVTTFGIAPNAAWQAANITSQRGYYRFDLMVEGSPLGPVQLAVPGRHNVQNAVAAAAIAAAAGAPTAAIFRGLESFDGLRRRLQTNGQIGGVPWIDDYAHHPTEIRAALAAVRELTPNGRVWCVFQPHQTSRTAALLGAFAASLVLADRVWITEIFHARESPPAVGEVSAVDLAVQARQLGAAVSPEHGLAAIRHQISAALSTGELTPRDTIVTMGAGDVGKLGDDLVRRFGKYRAAG